MNSKYLKSIAVLSIICLTIAALLGVVNFITAPVIEQAEIEATNKALAEVRPGADSFTPLTLTDYEGLDATITDIYSDTLGGYVVKLTTAGHQAGLVIMVGIDENGAVSGAKCLASAETYGEEKTYGDKTVGATAETIDSVATVSGVTKTTKAYRNAVKAALDAAIIISAKGGSQ